MAKFPSCILLTRVGGFYESYFDQAPILASLVNIKLATRTWGGRTVPMAGFPIVQLEKYLKMLVIDHRKLIAICDEFKEITSSITVTHDKIVIKRRVTRVVSPGTLIDETFLDPLSSNWIVSVAKGKHANQFGLAWLDVSTADFGTTICHDEQSMRDELARLNPIEIVLQPNVFTHNNQNGDRDSSDPSDFVIKDGPLWEALDPAKVYISFTSLEQQLEENSEMLKDGDETENLAVQILTAHLRTRLLDFSMDNVEDWTGLPEAAGVNRRRRDDVMTIDASTLSALEISTTQRRDEVALNAFSQLSTKGSLLSHIRRTVTKGGARLLAQWLTSPSKSLPLIHRRQALVGLFHQHGFMSHDLRWTLKKRAGDIHRALQRILTSRNDEQDLLEVRDFARLSADLVQQIKTEINMSSPISEQEKEGWTKLQDVVNAFEDVTLLGQRLGDAIDENVIEKRLRAQEDRAREMEENLAQEDVSRPTGNVSLQKVPRRKRATAPTQQDDDHEQSRRWGPPFEHLIRPNSSEQLSVLTKEHLMLRRKAAILQNELREKYGEKISLRFLLGQGYVVHVSDVREASKLAQMEEEMTLAYKSKSTRTYYHSQFTRIGGRLTRIEQELQEKEAVELQRLRLEVLTDMPRIRKNAALMHELDVLAGFATLAQELNLVRPVVHDGDELKIEGGRHLGVEQSLLQPKGNDQSTGTSRPFTPNDIYMNAQSRLHLITGPNMGGKSTLLRMVAIIAILAQVGSFVPAKNCSIGVIDQIFSRIGAHDAIHADRSTFMVEMLEVAQFLRRSTKRSLIVCDELGRGTSYTAGTALAYATAHQLVADIQCKCLFATHLHGIADLLEGEKGVDYFCTDLEKTEDGNVQFSHRIRPGLNRESHGLDIAKLAGMPEKVLEKASSTLTHLQALEKHT
ncbi:uncharacterized protein FA14DRAFT_163464 [Meira miltonrushii]|uniref:DNA mismatch repair proteins mutS family domain-containing protein n=1 Tax=Meira miltonrushii TaxID=1280837 RepID=A0A316VJE4_9BASI|nr:uncharacterized protein FA14DRAFT_163464 [Meira miltonrushii]PWN37729.1 hypothetical protein FA14DRAFT_163464 [Meira miltonrushii]